jgi:tryptophan-rich sensory protein
MPPRLFKISAAGQKPENNFNLKENRKMQSKFILAIVLSVALCLVIGFIGSVATMPNIPTWYATLNKPAFTPPNWLFGPAWTTLYLLMGIAAALVWNQGWEKRAVKTGLAIFSLQLALNFAWSFIFFGQHWLLASFIEIVALWVTIIWCMLACLRVSRLAGWLLVPYLLWVTFASILNFTVWWLNK